MDISIIIVNYNTKELLKNCINSIFKYTKDILFEIIIVDNASTDGSQEFIKMYFPEVFLIESKINLGFGMANNIAQKQAKGKYLFLLNSDTILLNNAIKFFFDFYENNTEIKIGALGGQLLENDGITKTHSSQHFPKLSTQITDIINIPFKLLFKKKIFSTPKENFLNSQDEYTEVDYITGADLFISNEIINKIGFFDPIFFMYYEETDLQKRLQNLGYKRLIINNVRIVHLEGASFQTKKLSGKKLSMIETSKLKYFKKHTPILNYYVFRIFYFLITLPLIFDYRIGLNYRFKLLKIRLQIF